VVSSGLRSQLLADLRAATWRTQIPPVIGLIGVFGAIRVVLLFLGGGHKSGRGSREPALPSGVAARGCPRALMHVPWCRHRAVGRLCWPCGGYMRGGLAFATKMLSASAVIIYIFFKKKNVFLSNRDLIIVPRIARQLARRPPRWSVAVGGRQFGRPAPGGQAVLFVRWLSGGPVGG
jgi:hypothetical protein